MKYDVEARIVERRQVCHVAADESHIERFSIGDQAIAFQLPGGLVQHGDICAGGSEYWSLLSAA